MLPIALIVVSFVCRFRSDSFLSALKAAANREYHVGSVGVKLSGHSLTIVTIICASSTPILSLVSAVLVISFFACRPIKFYLNFLLKKKSSNLACPNYGKFFTRQLSVALLLCIHWCCFCCFCCCFCHLLASAHFACALGQPLGAQFAPHWAARDACHQPSNQRESHASKDPRQSNRV